MESIDFATFVERHKITDHSTGLQLLVDYISSQNIRIDLKLGDDEHRTSYLRHPELRMLWAKNIVVLTSQQYSLRDLPCSVEVSVPEDKLFGQNTNYPRVVRKQGGPNNHYRPSGSCRLASGNQSR